MNSINGDPNGVDFLAAIVGLLFVLAAAGFMSWWFVRGLMFLVEGLIT